MQMLYFICVTSCELERTICPTPYAARYGPAPAHTRLRYIIATCHRLGDGGIIKELVNQQSNLK